MKSILSITLIALLCTSCSSVQHAYEGAKKDKSQLAFIRGNASEVWLEKIDGTPISTSPANLMHPADLYVEPGEHCIEVKYFWSSGLGSSSVISQRRETKTVCFVAEAGKRYLVRTRPGAAWRPYVELFGKKGGKVEQYVQAESE